MDKRGTIFPVLLLIAAMGPFSSAKEPGAAPPKGMFAQFVGVCQAEATEREIWKYLSAVRLEPSWGMFQPNGPDEWNQKRLAEFGQTVLANRKKGVEVLPCLDYMQPWAARKRAWSFTVGDKRYAVAAFDGRADKRKVTVTNVKTGEKKETEFGTGRMPPEEVSHWETYVGRVVKFLAASPYNVRYFQIWNEANDSFTGFWKGGMDEYMRTIHLPAARIIRKHGAKVVYGGYPCNGTMTHYLDVLDRHKAWDTLDVLDIHYFPLSAWQFLYERTKDRNGGPAIWQTEVGFTRSASWVPNHYPRFFHWALTHDWRPDRYKIFQFAHWSPDDPKAYGFGCCFLKGDRLSHHGKAFVTLGRLLDAPKVRDYPDWRTRPTLRTEIDERKSSVEGFHCGGRIVLAIHLADQNGAAIFTDWRGSRDNLHVEWPDTNLEVLLPKLAPARVARAWRVGIYGHRQPVAPQSPEAGQSGVRILLPTRDGDDEAKKANRKAKMHTFYLLLELAR